MASEEELIRLTIIFRRSEFCLNANIHSTVGQIGEELRRLTHVAPHTMRLLTPQNRRSFSASLFPFSDEHANITLQVSGLTEDTVLRMMGSLPEELKEIDIGKEDRSIIGFSEEDRRAKQRSAQTNTASWKLPQGSYKFSQFQTLKLPGIELDPAPDKAFEIMHKLASDPGIVSIMNKHQWRVGLMTEMAPLGYVGITPKCILGFNKNHGEEISLRLRTDDLKGFRKYESIKKTLLHELAHMVYSEHDANFFALDRQLNEESVALDWTKAKGHTWGKLEDYDENNTDLLTAVQSDNLHSGYTVGGSFKAFRSSARSAAAAAALHRLGNVPTKPEETCSTSHSDNDNMVAAQDCEDFVNKNGTGKFSVNRDSKGSGGCINNIDEVSCVRDFVAPGHGTCLNSLHHLNTDTGSSSAENITLETNNSSNVFVSASNSKNIEDEQILHLHRPDQDKTMEDVQIPDFPSAVQTNVHQVATSKDNSTSSITCDGRDSHWSGDLDLSVIQEPGQIVCRRLKQAITKLNEEASLSEASLALHTLTVILRNAIEHPKEAKFKRLKKANPLFQSRVGKFLGALDVLHTVGFSEQPGGLDGADYLTLERNDPGLLWLTKSFLETCMG